MRVPVHVHGAASAAETAPVPCGHQVAADGAAKRKARQAPPAPGARGERAAAQEFMPRDPNPTLGNELTHDAPGTEIRSVECPDQVGGVPRGTPAAVTSSNFAVSMSLLTLLVIGLPTVQDEIDNPDYRDWAAFKIGSWVKIER